MRRIQRVSNLDPQFQHTIKGQQAVSNAMFESLPFDVLQDHVGLVSVFSDLMNRADVGMIERRCRPCFTSKTIKRVGVPRKVIMQKLQGDKAP